MNFFKKIETEAGEELKLLKEKKKKYSSFEMYRKLGGHAEVLLKTEKEWEEEFLAFVDPTVLYDSKIELKKDYYRYKKEIDKMFEEPIYILEEEEKRQIENIKQLKQENDERLERYNSKKEKIAYNNSQECLDYLNHEFDKILSDKNN